MTSPESTDSGATPAPSHWLPDLTAAALCAVVTLAYAGSFGQLVFGGELAPFAGRAVLAALITGICMNLVLSWRSSFKFSLGGADSNPSAILAASVASIAATLGAGATSGTGETATMLPTVTVYLFGSAALCGLCVAFVGARGWGRYVRYIPYPVVGGFLSGTGYLLLAGAFKMTTGRRLNWEFWQGWSEVPVIAWGTTVVVAAGLMILSRKFTHYLVVPSIIVATIAAFHLMLFGLGWDFASARAEGLLLAPLTLGEWSTWISLDYAAVDWTVLVSHLDDVGAMTMLVIVATLLNTTSLEHATATDAKTTRELEAIGWGNIVASIMGGFVGMISFNRSWLNRKAGATTGWAARLCALMVAAIVLFAPQLVGLLPRPVLTGLILYLGINLLYTWLVEARSRMLPSDHLIVMAIVAIIAAFGAVAGVACGVIIACVSLAFTLSRNPSIRYRFTARSRHANVERPPHEQALLQQHGEELQGFSLQGILFFGTVNNVLTDMREHLERVRLLLLDFRLVHGMDGSAAVVLQRVQSLCRDAGTRLVFTGLNAEMQAALAGSGLDFSDRNVRCFDDVDLGLEWCEERIIARTNESTAPLPIAHNIIETIDADLLREFESREVAVGEVLMKRGDPGDEMFIIKHGRLQVQISSRIGGQDIIKRLRTYGPGTLVGEMGFYSGAPRSADIVSVEPTAVYAITQRRLTALEAAHPGFSDRLHRYVINTLALRLRSANDEILQLL
ncbi:SulP family inorganic anion transporter [Synoicihabitans lomoniglobus]|uniref:SulP family inorganic anion transporter n=1 Tax=Synoicihabitans lomoniglobus TaxID=2909285 RepID=A0AAE9ZU36_9BACT|nr:cyclic nucleotide-binding domain-containing protein [Opitutaceae bacterium LMO-M01]WED63059.1 SulP family inorganic anion transporter [Opitutaceae bacterium LMO-M01]